MTLYVSVALLHRRFLQARASDQGSKISRANSSSAVSRGRTRCAVFSVDDDLGGARPRVVVRAHRHRVGAGGKDGEQVAFREVEHTVVRQEIRALADRADDLPDRGRRRSAARPRAPRARRRTAPGAAGRSSPRRRSRNCDPRPASGSSTRVSSTPALPTSMRPGSNSSLSGRFPSRRADRRRVIGRRYRLPRRDSECRFRRPGRCARARCPPRQAVDQIERLGGRLAMRFQRRDLRADVHVDAAHGDVGAGRRRAGTAAARRRNAMPNLSSLRPVEMYRMGLRIDVRIDAKAYRRPLAERAGDPASRCSSSLADSTLKHSMPSCSALAISASVLPTPENTILRRIAAGGDRARELAARHDVEAAAQAREQVERSPDSSWLSSRSRPGAARRRMRDRTSRRRLRSRRENRRSTGCRDRAAISASATPSAASSPSR